MNGDTLRLSKDTAFEMAVFSGDLLYMEQDEAHAWALTLIISNLFELVGDGETSADRFADGFSKIARLDGQDNAVLGWDIISLARTIRNWIDHGLQLDRPQEMNARTKTKARVERIDFMPMIEDGDSSELFRVYCIGEDSYELLFSPMVFWSDVQNWYEGKP